MVQRKVVADGHKQHKEMMDWRPFRPQRLRSSEDAEKDAAGGAKLERVGVQNPTASDFSRRRFLRDAFW